MSIINKLLNNEHLLSDHSDVIQNNTFSYFEYHHCDIIKIDTNDGFILDEIYSDTDHKDGNVDANNANNANKNNNKSNINDVINEHKDSDINNSSINNNEQNIKVNKTFNKFCNKLSNLISIDIKAENLIDIVQYKYYLNKNIQRIISLYNKTFPLSIHKIFYIDNFFNIIKDNKNVPFWNDDIKEKSRGLFLPIEEFMEPDINSSESFTKHTWFKSEFKKEKYDCFHLNELNYTPGNEIYEITRTRNIKLYFNKQQKEAMKIFLGAYRCFYNRTISVLNNYDKITKKSYYYADYKDENTKCLIEVPVDKSIYNYYYLRPILKKDIPKWIDDIGVPKCLLDLAINEAIEKTKENFKKHSKFKMKKKTKKDLRQTFKFEKYMLNQEGMIPNFKYKGKYIFRKIKKSEKIGNCNYCDSSITYHRVLNTFTLNLSYKIQTKANKSKKVGSIDPGLREFVAIYSDNKVCKIGIESTDHLLKVCKEIDIIDSRLNKKTYYVKNKTTGERKKYKVNSKRKKQLRKAKHRKIRKVENLKKELHDETINYICENYSKIIIPPFEIQKMVSKLKSKTARSMYNLSFYEFREKLISKAEEKNCEIEIRPEYYTSKTCTKCGNIKNELKMKDEIYSCKKCGLKIDRNYSGARNIMLRNN
jgi:putative transposase